MLVDYDITLQKYMRELFILFILLSFLLLPFNDVSHLMNHSRSLSIVFEEENDVLKKDLAWNIPAKSESK